MASFFPRDCGKKNMIPARHSGEKIIKEKKDVLLNNGYKCEGNGEEVGRGDRQVKQPPTWGNIVLPN